MENNIIDTIKITAMGLVEDELYEVKFHFKLLEKDYFGMLNLKSGSFISNAVTLTDDENQALVHYLSHRAEEYLEEQGIELPPELKCQCH